MSKKRYDVPPLDLIQGFEAAARNLSFTKAAEELFLTQSAVSRQIKQLEDVLGVKLFERQHRALILTADGDALHKAAIDILERLQTATRHIKSTRNVRQLAITTTTGFAALWLIPRLNRFTAAHPDADVRISATDVAVNLDRGVVDVAIRYCTRESAPNGSIPLFGEEILPVCSPSLLAGDKPPLKVPADLRHHALLHFDYPGMQKTWFDWQTWLTAFGIGDLKTAGSLHFSQYDQMINAAMMGQGIALGRLPLIQEHIRSGALIAPFEKSVVGTRGYAIIEAPHARENPLVAPFRTWLLAEAAADTAG